MANFNEPVEICWSKGKNAKGVWDLRERECEADAAENVLCVGCSVRVNHLGWLPSPYWHCREVEVVEPYVIQNYEQPPQKKDGQLPSHKSVIENFVKWYTWQKKKKEKLSEHLRMNNCSCSVTNVLFKEAHFSAKLAPLLLCSQKNFYNPFYSIFCLRVDVISTNQSIMFIFCLIFLFVLYPWIFF